MARVIKQSFLLEWGAHAIALMHLIWTLLIFVGVFLVLIDHAYAPLNVGVLVMALVVNIPFPSCPLTLLEQKMRKKIDPEYNITGSFMATYLNKILGTNVSARSAKIGIGIFYAFSGLLTIFALTHP